MTPSSYGGGRTGSAGPTRRLGPAIVALLLLLALPACTSSGRTSSGGPTSSAPTTSPGPTWSPTTPLVGAYLGRHGSEAFRAEFGRYPQVETNYFDADRVTTPDVGAARQQIDEGTSPVITLGWRNGPFTRAEIAAWGPEVQSYFAVFVAALRGLSQYAATKANGTHVYFADEHEAVVKINQRKYTFSGYEGAQPTVADSAAAWNKVMAYVRQAAPLVVRTYWYGGSGANEDVFAAALRPGLIQLATVDIYRWAHSSSSATPEQLWSGTLERLAQQPWMRDAQGRLKPWAVTEWGTNVSHGDAANALFVPQALAFFADHGASFQVYFDRVDGSDPNFDWLITPQGQPLTYRAFHSALSG